jgi:transcriptional regulator with XRE-family HTH domain
MQAIFVTPHSLDYDPGMQTGRPSKRPRSLFGARLHTAREAAGLTQAQVAEQLGITQTAYALWERREMALKPEQIELIANILSVSLDYLFGRSAPRSNGGGPVGKARQTFEAVSHLPRRQQQHIVRVVDALLAQAKVEA